MVANTVKVGYVCILHERNPLLGSKKEHHPIVTTAGIRTPGLLGGSPFCVVQESEGDIEIGGHWRLWLTDVEEGKYGG